MTQECPYCHHDNRDTAQFCAGCGNPLAPGAPRAYVALQPGQVIHGVYRILRSIGKGGMGTVYLVEDLGAFGRRRVIKEMLQYFDLTEPWARSSPAHRPLYRRRSSQPRRLQSRRSRRRTGSPRRLRRPARSTSAHRSWSPPTGSGSTSVERRGRTRPSSHGWNPARGWRCWTAPAPPTATPGGALSCPMV